MTDVDLGRLLRRSPGEPIPQFLGPQEAVISRVSVPAVFFTIPRWSGTQEFGPVVNATTATVGQQCLVLFAEPGVDRPWIVAWRT